MYIYTYKDVWISFIKCFYYFILKKALGEFKKLAGSQKLFQVKKYQTKKRLAQKSFYNFNLEVAIKIPNHQM